MAQIPNINEMKLQVIQALLSTQDAGLILRVLDLVEGDGNIESSYQLDEINKLESVVQESLADYERGEVMTLEELDEESKTWI